MNQEVVSTFLDGGVGQILLNMGSGSIGVLVTLALTGWWGWRERRRIRRFQEFDVIVNYVKEMEREAMEFVAFKAILEERNQHDDGEKIVKKFVEYWALVINGQTEILSRVSDPYVRFYIKEIVTVTENYFTVTKGSTKKNLLSEADKIFDSTVELLRKIIDRAHSEYALPMTPSQRFVQWKLGRERKH